MIVTADEMRAMLTSAERDSDNAAAGNTGILPVPTLRWSAQAGMPA